LTIDLWRRPDGPLRIGHRGAAALAPENTLRSFRAAAAADVHLIEFDVLDLPRGPLVVAHSDHLDEVSNGAATGRVSDLSLEELRELVPELATFDDALAFFADEAPGIGLHVDLKLRTRLDELAAAIERHGLADRTVVSGVHVRSLQAVVRHAPRVRLGVTYPEDRLSISRRQYLWPVVSLGLTAMRASVPYRLGRLARRAGASVLMLQHRLVSAAAVERAHALGLPVLAWTVDEPDDLRRVVDAGADGVITNDPRIFTADRGPRAGFGRPGYTESQ
jgi:glycerophosphoryl diester phosphodiesterase